MVAVSNSKSLTQPNFTGTVTVFNSAASTTTIAATNLVQPQDWNSGLNVFMTPQGNTAGTSAVSGTVVHLAGGNNITLSGSQGAGAATLSIQGVGPRSDMRPNDLNNNTSWLVPTNNELYFLPAYPQGLVNASVVQMPVSFGGTSTATTTTRDWSITFSACLYQIDVGANSTQMTSRTSVTGSIAISRTSSSATYTTALNGNTGTTTASNYLSNAVILRLPMASTYVPAQTYFFGFAVSTATGGQNSGGAFGMLVMTDINSNFAQWASNTFNAQASSLFFDYDAAVYSTTSASWPSTIPFSALNRATSGEKLYVEFVNQ